MKLRTELSDRCLTKTSFNRVAKKVIEEIKEDEPIAIVRVDPGRIGKEYLPGITELDLLVLAVDDIDGVVTTLIEEFIGKPGGIKGGHPFLIEALRSGKVEHDPLGVIEKTKQREDIAPILSRGTAMEDDGVFAILNRNSLCGSLSFTATRYLLPGESYGSKRGVAQRLYSTALVLARTYAEAFKLNMWDGPNNRYHDLVKKLKTASDPDSTPLALLQRARKIAEDYDSVTDSREGNPPILALYKEDPFSTLLHDLETFSTKLGFIPDVPSTRAVVKKFFENVPAGTTIQGVTRSFTQPAISIAYETPSGCLDTQVTYCMPL